MSEPSSIPSASATPAATPSLSGFALNPLVVALACGAGLGSAHAQTHTAPDADNQHQRVHTLDTVEVSGDAPYKIDAASSTKLTAPLLDTPQTVVVIPKQLIDDRGLSSLADVLRTTPGITLGAGEGGTPTGDRPFVRGYEASNDMTIDGIRDFARGYHETFNLEAVEILKGPSSAYGGRGGTGGSINMQTKTPKARTFAEVRLGAGNADQWTATVDGNLAFSERIAMRLNLMKMGGETPGRDFVGIDRFGFAPALTFGLGTPTRVTLQYSRVNNNDTPDQGFPFSSTALARNPDYRRPPKVRRSNFYGRRNVDFREGWAKQGTLVFEHEFSDDLQLRNITRHTDTLNHYFMGRPTFDHCAPRLGNVDNSARSASSMCDPDSPDATYRSGTRLRWRGSEGLVNQTDLAGTLATGAVTHHFTTGLEFARDRLYDRSMNVTGITDDNNNTWYPLHDPVSDLNYAYTITYGDKVRVAEIETRSVYLFDTMKLSEQFLINTGLRFEKYTVTDPVRALERKDDLFNYQLGLVWKPASNGSVYLNYSTSSNPAGENISQGGGADGVAGGTGLTQGRDQLRPEKTHSVELGTKWDVLDEKLSLTAAVFETKKTDARSTDPVSGITTLDGDNRVRGLELGASGAITQKWDVWAGYTYMDHEMTRYRSGNSDYSGNAMKFIPKHSASLWTTYAILPQLSIGGGATYMGMRYADDGNNYELPSYLRLDLMAKYTFNSSFSLQFNVNNLTDTELYDSSHVGIFYNVGPGRSYLLTLNYRYD